MPDGYLIEIYSVKWLGVYVCGAFVLKWHPDTLPSCPTAFGKAAHLSMILPVPSGTRGSPAALVVCSCFTGTDNLISICKLSRECNNNAQCSNTLRIFKAMFYFLWEQKQWRPTFNRKIYICVLLVLVGVCVCVCVLFCILTADICIHVEFV